MKVKDLREFLNSLPKELNNYDIVYSEVKIIDEENELWARKDIPLESSVIDSDHEELIIAKYETIESMIKLSGQSDEEG